MTPYFRLALVRKVWSSSYILNLPNCMTVRRNVESITFVKLSASIMAVDTQRHIVWSLDCSFRSITSIVVRHSWQLGTAVLVIRFIKWLTVRDHETWMFGFQRYLWLRPSEVGIFLWIPTCNGSRSACPRNWTLRTLLRSASIWPLGLSALNAKLLGKTPLSH